MTYVVVLHDVDEPAALLSQLRDSLRGVAIIVHASLAVLDQPDQAGIANVAAALSVNGTTLIGASDIYRGTAIDDDLCLPDSKTLMAISALVNSRGVFGLRKLGLLFMLDWDNVEAPRYLRGGVADLRSFLKLNGGWASVRMNLGSPHVQEDPFDPLLFVLNLDDANA